MTWDGIKIEEKKMRDAKLDNPKSRGNYSMSPEAKKNFDEIDWKKKK